MPLEFDEETIVTSTPVKGNDNKYFVAIKKQNGDLPEQVYFQLNNVKCEKNEDKTMEARLDNLVYIDFIKEIEQKILILTQNNAQEWFGKEFSESYFENAKMSALKDVPKSKMAIFKTLKCPNFQVFNTEKEIIEDGEITKGTIFNAIVEVQGIWFSKTRFGVTYKLKQAKVKHETKIQNCLFNDDDDELDNVYPFED